MGQAKQRGTFEQRQAQAVEREAAEARDWAERRAVRERIEHARSEKHRIAREEARRAEIQRRAGEGRHVILIDDPMLRRRNSSRILQIAALLSLGAGARLITNDDL